MSSLEHPAERGGSEQAGGAFERFSQGASNLTSSPLFFGFCVLLVAAFLGVHAGGAGLAWELGIDGGMSAVTLLLLALLKNSENQTEHAIETKLDAMAMVLLARSETDRRRAQQDLAEALRHDEDA